MSRPGKFRALLATLRIANAPSVVSNVWLGFMVGWLAQWNWWDPDKMPWGDAAIICLSGLLLYFSGNLANDWFDRKWDATMRPERALPSGLFAPSAYLIAALGLAIAGIAAAFRANPMSVYPALFIIAAISIYTYFHKKAIWAVIPMGLCRAGLYFLGFFATWSWTEVDYFNTHGGGGWSMAIERMERPAILAVGLFSYIAGLSLSARYEGMADAPQGPKVISLAMLILPIAAMSSSFMGYFPLFGIVGMLPFAAWLALCLTQFRKPIPRYVSALLAGIPLVDFIAAVPISLGLSASLLEQDLFELPHMMALLAVPLVAFVLGRLLQKVAPAT